MAKNLELADTEPAFNVSMRPGSGRITVPWKTILLLATVGAGGTFIVDTVDGSAVLATGTGKAVDDVITALQNLGLVAQA